MTDAGMIEASFFQPWHIGLYLFVLFVIMVVYYQWRWSSTCKNNIQVLVAQAGGGGDFALSPKVGNTVSIKKPGSDTVRLWPMNELATIEVPYPGVGFVPSFLQKTIRLAIVNEGDWEPMLNRSRHYKGVASPDVVAELIELATGITGKSKVKDKLIEYVKTLSTSPTREMIASPAVLGNLMHEKITEAVITVNKEMLDQLQGLMSRMNKVLSPLVFFIGIGIVIVILIFIAFQIIPVMSELSDLGDISDKLDAIQKALGVIQGGG